MTDLGPHHLVLIPPAESVRVPDLAAAAPTPPAAAVSSGEQWWRRRAERLRYRIARWLLDAMSVPPLATSAAVCSQLAGTPAARAPALADGAGVSMRLVPTMPPRHPRPRRAPAVSPTAVCSPISPAASDESTQRGIPQ